MNLTTAQTLNLLARRLGLAEPCRHMGGGKFETDETSLEQVAEAALLLAVTHVSVPASSGQLSLDFDNLPE